MKPAETKQEFIRLRADGLSYRAIQEKIGVCKSTCSEWEQAYKKEIAQLKADSMSDLYNAYGMTREARIKKLGSTLNRLQTALDDVDLTALPPEKLLDYYLRYSDALKSEYLPLSQPLAFKRNNLDPAEITGALADLLNRIRAGEVGADQASRENTTINTLLKAYETTQLKEKMETLETLIGSRS